MTENFINNITLEGVVVEPPSQIMTSKNGIAISVIVWHHTNGNEMLFRAMSNSSIAKSLMGNLNRGDLVTFYGAALFLKRRKDASQPFIIVSTYNIRSLNVDGDYGEKLLENANLSDVNKLAELKLPWDK